MPGKTMQSVSSLSIEGTQEESVVSQQENCRMSWRSSDPTTRQSVVSSIFSFCVSVSQPCPSRERMFQSRVATAVSAWNVLCDVAEPRNITHVRLLEHRKMH
jgi:hypothetical protein